MSDAANHEIFKLAVPLVGDALRARTLAECLYWVQKAGHKIDGQPAIWKTGPQLAEVLGIRPRTANEHMKYLARLGFWKLDRRPRPNSSSPSPVTWLIPLEPSLDLLRRARTEAVSKAVTQSVKTSPKAPSSEVPADIQMSVEPSSLQLPSLLSGQSPLHCPSGTQGEKSKSKSTAWDPGKKASEEARSLMEAVNAYRLQKSALLWDTGSQFPWQHMEALSKELEALKVCKDQWVPFVQEVHDHWAYIRENLPKPYRVHPLNVSWPSSKPLGDEASKVVALVLKIWADRAEKAAAKAAKAAGSSYKF